jgi:hypothetical protein
MSPTLLSPTWQLATVFDVSEFLHGADLAFARFSSTIDFFYTESGRVELEAAATTKVHVVQHFKAPNGKVTARFKGSNKAR